MPNLTALKINSAPAGVYSDGEGLRLFKRENGGRWEWRYQFLGRRRDMGLGSWPAVSLKEARQMRDKWAAVRREGKDPLTVRNAQREATRAALTRTAPTFAAMAAETLKAKRDGLRGGGDRGRWFSPLELHVIPKIGKMRIADIHQQDIHDALKPIWRKKHPTAKKAIERTRAVFYHAQMTGADCDPVTVDRAKHMLGEVKSVATNHPAVAWQDAPKVFTSLNQSVSGHCVRFLMLTAVRSAAARGAMFSEISGDVWTVPLDRIKGAEGKVADFRVPVSAQMRQVIDQCRVFGSDHLFPSPAGRSGISDVAAAKALKAVAAGKTLHGLRSTFRTWVEDHGLAFEVAEAVLGHSVGNKVERAYQRSDLLERRAAMMQDWADYLSGG